MSDNKKHEFKLVKVGKQSGLSKNKIEELKKFVASNRDSSGASKKIASKIFREMPKSQKKHGKSVKFIVEKQTPLKDGTKKQRGYTATYVDEKVTIKRDKVDVEVNKPPIVKSCLVVDVV